MGKTEKPDTALKDMSELGALLAERGRHKNLILICTNSVQIENTEDRCGNSWKKHGQDQDYGLKDYDWDDEDDGRDQEDDEGYWDDEDQDEDDEDDSTGEDEDEDDHVQSWMDDDDDDD